MAYDRSLLIATLLASWLAFCFRPVFHDFRGRRRYQGGRRYTCTTRGHGDLSRRIWERRMPLWTQYYFKRWYRRGAWWRQKPRSSCPPPLHERVCNARGNENRWNRVLCVGVENVWAAVRTFHAFCGIPSLRFFNLSMGEWNLCSVNFYETWKTVAGDCDFSSFWIEWRIICFDTIFSEIWEIVVWGLFNFRLNEVIRMKWRLESVVNLDWDVVAFEFFPEIWKWFSRR